MRRSYGASDPIHPHLFTHGGPLWTTAFPENDCFEKHNLEKTRFLGKTGKWDSWEFPPSNMEDPSLLSALGWVYGLV